MIFILANDRQYSDYAICFVEVPAEFVADFVALLEPAFDHYWRIEGTADQLKWGDGSELVTEKDYRLFWPHLLQRADGRPKMLWSKIRSEYRVHLVAGWRTELHLTDWIDKLETH